MQLSRSLAASLALLAACASAAQLEPSDLMVAGIASGQDSAAVLRVFSAPLRRTEQGPSNLGSLSTWYYPHLTVRFWSLALAQLELTDSTYATTRGARVGDRFDRVMAVYGAPTYRPHPGRDTTFAMYLLRGRGPVRGALFTVVADTVRAIQLGQLDFVWR